MGIKRRYAYAGDRRVHYRRAGTGPPLVMLHASPGSSYVLEPLIALLARSRTVIAIDTPGYGESEGLGIEEPEIEAFAAALVDTLDSLGLDRFDLYGTHTGSKIAVEFAGDNPGRVRRLVLDGIGAYTPEERADLLANYTIDLSPEWDGTHLIRAWAMRRDMHMFWPWFSRDGDHRMAMDIPSTEEMHDHFVDFLRAVPDYGKAYRASFRYNVPEGMSRLGMPTLMIALPADPLYQYLAGGADLGEDVTVETGATDIDRLAQITTRFLGAGEQLPDAAPEPEALPVPGAFRRHFVEVSVGALHVHWSGGEGRPLVMLHASPTSARNLDPLTARFAPMRPVIAFDNPGNGDSSPVPDEPEITDLAEVLVEGLDALGVGEFDLYGSHTGAHIAIEVAISQGPRVTALILDGIIPYEESQAREWLDHYPPPMVPDRHGSHLVWAWNFMRDQVVFWPWFSQSAESVRHGASIPDPAVLHDRVLEMLKGGRTYHHQYAAAFRYRTQERLPLVGVPTLVCAGPTDPLLEHLAAVPDILSDAEMLAHPGLATDTDADDTVFEFVRFLSRAGGR